MTSPWVTVYLALPAMTPARVLLPLPLGPMMEWTSPTLISRFTPLRISLSPMEACKLRMDNRAIVLCNCLSVCNFTKNGCVYCTYKDTFFL